MDPATILFSLAAAGLKAVKVKDLAHTFRHELKIDGVFRLYTAMRLETGFDEVVDVVRDAGRVVSRTWVSEEAMDEPIPVIDPVGGQITLLEDTGGERVVRAKGSTRLTIGRNPRNVRVFPMTLFPGNTEKYAYSLDR